MPTVPLRRKFIDELDDIDRSFKRARLEKYIQSVRDDLHLLGPSDDVSISSCSSCSSVSSISTISSLSSDGDNTDNLSTESLLLTALEDLAFHLFQAELQALRNDVELTQILNHHAPLRHEIRKKAQVHLLDVWREDNVLQFRRKVRVEPDTFDALLAKIENDDVFHNESSVPQTPVKIQLAIFLYRAGHYGNAASLESISHWAGVSVSSVVDCTNRVMIALLRLHDEVIHLPTPQEKEAAKQWVEEQVCAEWRDGFIMVDRTEFSFSQRPGLHGDIWSDKNRDHSLDCQLVTLPDSLLIVDYSIVYTGSVHDSWSFQSTRVFKEHDQIFAPGEWLWADSTYPTETWCLSPFKKLLGSELTHDQKTYNYHVSRVRIRSEHAIGLLKGRFQALRQLHIQIRTSKLHKWAIMFVRCCLIMHNLIIHLEGGDYDPEFREELYECGRGGWEPNGNEEENFLDEGPRTAQRQAQTPGQHFRKEIMSRLFQSVAGGVVNR